jgi:hypothetical protein
LAEGDAFGERALKDNSKRNSTVITNEFVQLLIIKKEEFN